MHSHGAFVFFKFPNLWDWRVIDSVPVPESNPGLRIRSDLGLLDEGAYKMGVQTSVIITWLSLRTGIRWKNSKISNGVEIKKELTER